MPAEVVESFAQLFKLATENGVPFEDLCVYALGLAAEQKGQEPESS